MTDEVLLRPTDAIGTAMKQFVHGKPDEAENILRAVLKADPGNADAMHRLGFILADKGEYYEALYRLDRALKINRKNPTARSNRGMVLGELGHHGEALADLEISISLERDNPVTWNNKGNTLIFLDRNEEAVKALNCAIQLDPKHTLSWYNLGIALLRLGRTEQGIHALTAALALQPVYPDATFNLGLAQLFMGDFEHGFANYEARWDTGGYEEYRNRFPQSKWLGKPSDLAGKSIVVYGDQGLGDSIMFSRYLPLFAATGAKVYCNPHKPLRELFAATFDGVTWLNPGDEPPEIDYRCAFPSAPLAFGTKIGAVPAPVRFTVTPEIAIPSLAPLDVGICWSGNWLHVNDKYRSIPLKTFARLFDGLGAQGVCFHSLQYEVRDEEQETFSRYCPGISRPPLKSWTDTCRVIAALDLVITCDSAVAHAAAAMGVPTWILLPTPRIDWRWMKNRTDSPWYPAVTLFRQTKPGDWAEVIARVKREVTAMMERRKAA
jgi:Flp pilus assembly protein TadD